MPKWVEQGFTEFAQRLGKECPLILKEIEPAQRRKTADANIFKQEEATKIKQALPKGAYLIALEVGGESWSTEQLSQHFQQWLQQGQDVVFIVGGADGLHEEVLSMCHKKWSLSRLTYPHALVRIILAEQIYRAWSILRNHPYHRA